MTLIRKGLNDKHMKNEEKTVKWGQKVSEDEDTGSKTAGCVGIVTFFIYTALLSL